MFLQVLKFFQRLQIGVQAILLGIGHEHSVSPFQNEFSAGFVEHCPGPCTDAGGSESAYRAQSNGRKSKTTCVVSVASEIILP